MYVNELMPKSNIVIRVEKDDKHIDLTASLLQLSTQCIRVIENTFGKHFVAIAPMKGLTKINDTYKVSIIADKGSSSYTWLDGISFQYVKLQGIPYHIIICNKDASAKNLRQSYRQSLNLFGMIRKSGERNEDYVMIRDISVNGVGLAVSKNTNIHVGDKIYLWFNDDTFKENFELVLNVVRIKQLENNEVIVGCKFFNSDNDYKISKYITAKQREILRFGPNLKNQPIN